MTFLIRAMNKEYDALKISHGERMDYLQRFKDLETGISQWAYQYIVQAGRMGLTEGYPDGTMRGKGELNHAEVITLIDRMIISIKHNGL